GAAPEIYVEAVVAAEAPTVMAPEKPPARRLGIIFWLAVGWLTLVLVLALTAGWLPLHSWRRTGLGQPRLTPFSNGHFPLGTDELGRDMLARLIHGSRVSLIVGFSSIGLGLAVGGAIGVIAGYYRGRIESLLMGITDILLAFPALVLALAIVTFMGQSLRNVTLAIAILAIAPIARIIRASTLTFSEREFVLAARALGAKNRRIIIREILPNVALPAASFALVAVAVAIVAEGTLAFLGLSVPAPTPTWGGMIADGRTLLEQAPHISFVPS